MTAPARNAYRLSPVSAGVIAGSAGPVHFETPGLYKICRRRGAGVERGTRHQALVTCAGCLEALRSYPR